MTVQRERADQLVETVLDNGIRVVARWVEAATVDVVVVDYEVGIRDEEPGQQGFAHLFEHLMCDQHLNGTSHLQAVASLGGIANAMTRLDHTVFVNATPGDALDEVLRRERHRMTEFTLGQERLDREREVVRNEVSHRFGNIPYGSFPWSQLGRHCFDDTVHVHNDDGTFDDLDAVDVAAAAAFHARYYRPDTALVHLAGDRSTADLLERAHDVFGDVPAAPDAVRRQAGRYTAAPHASAGVYSDALATRPAAAFGFLTSPAASGQFAAEVTLAGICDAVLSGLPAAGGITPRAYVGLMDADGLAVRDPNLLVFELDGTADDGRRMLRRLWSTIDAADDDTVLRWAARGRLEIVRSWQWWGGRAMTEASAALLAGHARALDDTWDRLTTTSVADIRAALHRLTTTGPGVVEVRPC